MYDKADVLDRALIAIKEEELTTIDEVCCFLQIDISTLYLTEEWKFEVLEPIKKGIADMKISLKTKMKRDWRKSNQPTLQLAAYKLIADEEELERLTVNSNKNQTSGELNMTWNETKTYATNPQADGGN